MSIKTTLMWVRTWYRRIVSRVRCAAERETMVARFYVSGSQAAIEVRAPHKFKEEEDRVGAEHHLWACIIDHCSIKYSPNELLEIRAQLWQLLKERNAEDIPFIWWDMFVELSDAMKKRGVQFEEGGYDQEAIRSKCQRPAPEYARD